MNHCPLPKQLFRGKEREKTALSQLTDKRHDNMQEGKASGKEFLKWKLCIDLKDEQFEFELYVTSKKESKQLHSTICLGTKGKTSVEQ